MRSSSDSGIGSGESDRAETFDKKCDPGNIKNLYIVGIGPGHFDHMSQRALDVIKHADTIVGYTTYVDLIKPLIIEKTVISTTMKKEVDRVASAIDIALSGKKCVLVSSGDPGIYAMGGLVFEMCEQKDIAISRKGVVKTTLENKFALQIEVIPGIPALASCASLLGAPLTHDFATISLSDLLTPWEVIEKRIDSAAMADFVIVFYNPKSKKRDWQLNKAQKIILKYRNIDTPVGIVKNAMRKKQDIKITTLENLHEEDVDMLTTVIVGNSTSMDYMGFIVTPRGYSGKYKID